MTHETRAIKRKLTLQSSPAEVWDAITNPASVGQWFGETANYELQAGALGWLGWDDHGQFAMRIEAVEPFNYFAWRWMQQKDLAFNEGESTLVEWRLTELADGGTELSMIESGFKAPESRQDNVSGWQHELQDLCDYLTTE